MVTCVAHGGPMDGNEWEEPGDEAPAVFVNADGSQLYVLDAEAEGPRAVFRYANSTLLAQDPIPVMYELQEPTVGEVRKAVARLTAFGWGPEAVVQVRMGRRGRVVAVWSPGHSG